MQVCFFEKLVDETCGEALLILRRKMLTVRWRRALLFLKVTLSQGQGCCISLFDDDASRVNSNASPWCRQTWRSAKTLPPSLFWWLLTWRVAFVTSFLCPSISLLLFPCPWLFKVLTFDFTVALKTTKHSMSTLSRGFILEHFEEDHLAVEEYCLELKGAKNEI